MSTEQLPAVDPERGLSAAEVAARVADGRTNQVPEAPVRSLGEILRANLFTRVNAIMITLFVLILVAGFPKDGLFVGVVFSNAVIGVAQEVRARRELDRLALLSAPRARVIRDSEIHEVAVSEVVQDELLDLAPGDQIIVDGMVAAATGLEIDESLLTGEADPVVKVNGDPVLSGSFVSAGSGRFVATKIGAASYANTLAAEAKRFTLVNSELRDGINQILRWLVIVIPPASALLLWSLLDAEDRWEDALQGTVAAAVAMVPDGLVLLTSLSFLAGIIAIARRQALAKELATVELLARVDTLCLDKTGTITTGDISLGEVVALNGYNDDFVRAALGSVGHADPNPNPTLQAVIAHHAAETGWILLHTEPFSSARKWSATEFADHGLFYFGAPEMLLDDDDPASDQWSAAAAAGRRVLM
ncbi:MAG: HAD-IC family P-type ATPase, partial [Acidimicrobiia bacterium]|nr:HAD-IC family P-type ATPase [Acidimicrobiia bacterium]